MRGASPLGGWSDAQEQLKGFRQKGATDAPKAEKPKTDNAQRPKPQTKLSFKDEHRQKELDALIPKLQAEIAKLEQDMSDPGLYARDADAFNKKSARVGAAREELDMAEMEWLEIEEKREALAK